MTTGLPMRAATERISRGPVLAWLVLLVLLVPLLTTKHAGAEPHRLAIDVDQGALVEKSPVLYAFGGKLVPAYVYKRAQLALSLGVYFADAKWTGGVGLAPSFVLFPEVTPYTGLRVTGEATYFSTQEWRAVGGLVIDLDSVHLGEVAGYDSYYKSAIVLTTLGFDLPQVFRFLGELP